MTRNNIAVHYRDRPDNAKDPTQMWKCVKEMGVISKRKEDIQLSAICDAINDYFAELDNPLPLIDSRHNARVAREERFYF